MKKQMFNYTHAALQHLPLASVHIPGYHDINFDIIKGHVALLKDHPKQDLPPIIVEMKQEPRNAFANFAFGNGALCASPAIVDNIEKSRF